MTANDDHPRPRVVGDTSALRATDPPGAVWNLTPPERGLDANVIWLPAGDGIDEHTGPDLDVLIHVLSGGGRLEVEGEPIDLAPGVLVWLPKRARRRFLAGQDGLRYLTVHQRKQVTGIRLETPDERR